MLRLLTSVLLLAALTGVCTPASAAHPNRSAATGSLEFVDGLRKGDGRRTPGGSVAVRALQQQFGILGYPLGADRGTGVYGVRTEGAVRYFQRVSGLRVTGMADHATLAAIQRRVEALRAPRPTARARLEGDSAPEVAQRHWPEGVAVLATLLIVGASVPPRSRRRRGGRFQRRARLAARVAPAVAVAVASAVLVPAIATTVFALAAATAAGVSGRRSSHRPGRSPAARVETVFRPPQVHRPTVWVVIPTYQEAANVEGLVTAVLAALEGVTRALYVLVVDDGSPDGTGDIVERLGLVDSRVHLLRRARKEGIGPAYAAGFAAAHAGGAELICQMDCDFSHPPALLPEMVEAAAHADLVIGSRYVAGGAIHGWPAHRRAISRIGNWWARRRLRVPVRDLTGGLKCFTARVFDQVDPTTMQASGYGFQIEMTYEALMAGCSVTELPFTFRDRTAGASKMTLGIALEAARMLGTVGRRREPPVAAPVAEPGRKAVVR